MREAPRWYRLVVGPNQNCFVDTAGLDMRADRILNVQEFEQTSAAADPEARAIGFDAVSIIIACGGRCGGVSEELK